VDNYNAARCFGFARNWQSVAGDIFGGDRGFNYQASDAAPCRDSITPSGDYGYSQYPMATYAPGSTVCLAWPSKNHVAETCTNQYIPDTDLEIFAHGPNPTSDPDQNGFKNFVVTSTLNGKHAANTIDHKGFQNCSKFCDNMDKALCTGCFQVPSNLKPGAVYTFQWYWIFNPGSAPYTTCWEAKISGASSAAASSAATSAAATSAATTSAAATGQPSSGGSTASASTGTVLYGDVVVITNYPTVVPLTGYFFVDIAYSTSSGQEDQITVDILSTDANPTWFGKGIVNVTGSGTITLKVKIYTATGLTKESQYILRAWTVQSSKASDSAPWSYELDRQDVLVYAGEAPPKPTASGAAGATGVKDNSGSYIVYSVMLLASMILLLVL